MNIKIKREQTYERFEKYCSFLIKANITMNLTATDDPEEIYIRHFADSLAVKSALSYLPQRVIDVGCGAGFPGLPLKILADDVFEGGMALTLLDSTAKKTGFLKELCSRLSLKNVCVITERAEALAHDKNHREKYDLAVSRAVANLGVLAELCIPYVRVGGLFAPHKSQKAFDEIINAKQACAELGAELIETVPYVLGENRAQMLIPVIKKNKSTSAQYPRLFTRIKSKPL